jgi:hypothetical protein
MHPCRHEMETFNKPAMLAAVSKPFISRVEMMNSFSNDNKKNFKSRGHQKGQYHPKEVKLVIDK